MNGLTKGQIVRLVAAAITTLLVAAAVFAR